MAISSRPPVLSRRRFLRQILGAGALVLGGSRLPAAFSGTASGAGSFRFAFLTDLHLMHDGSLRSPEGIAACLAAVEKLKPGAEFILVGGDLVHRARDLTIAEAERGYDLFLKIWSDHTERAAYWTFGNHDLAGTSNPQVLPSEKDYGKGLFQDRLHLPRLFYSFDFRGWHFVVLDDIALQRDRSYVGQFFDDELAFLQVDLDAHRGAPTIICTHIPIASNVVLAYILAHDPTAQAKTLVCTNGGKLMDDIPGHNIRAVLSGHLHFFESFEQNGIRIVNSGAVCGSYWKGPNHGCREGFGVVDLASDGSISFEYRDYGWLAG